MQAVLKIEPGKPQNAAATVGRLGGYFGPYRAALVVVALLVITGTWSQVMTPGLIGQVVDCYLLPAGGDTLIVRTPVQATSNCWYTTATTDRTPEQASSGMAGLILRLVGLYLTTALTSGLQFYLMTWTSQHVLKQLRVDMFQHLQRLSLNFYAENEAGDVMSRITNDTAILQQAIGFALVNLTGGALLLVWIAFTMLRRSIPYALLGMSVTPFMALATVWFSGQARRAFRIIRQEIGHVNADLHESIAGVREVQAFNREGANLANFMRSNAANRDANIRAVAFTSALAPALEALGTVAVAVVIVTGGLALLRDQTMLGTTISLGLMVTFIGYVQRFNQPIQQISVLWTNIQSALAGTERIFGLLDTPAEVIDRPAQAGRPGALEMPSIQGRVEFIDVAAAYPRGECVLRGINLESKPGQTLAIVGPTGAGKTTLVSLIPRFYDVAGGAVKIDGIDVRDVTRASLRRQIGLVLQDTFLFSDTVMNNIRYGRPEASDAQVIAAARLVQADQFIERLPQAYQTVLGERGTGLSQGQRQLIAIARAALADPRILILDEATSSVDTRTERLIQQALDQLLKGRTSFVIAHRFSTIRNADQVLVLNDGQIVEHGTHAELWAAHGFYYEVCTRQFRREEQEPITTCQPVPA